VRHCFSPTPTSVCGKYKQTFFKNRTESGDGGDDDDLISGSDGGDGDDHSDGVDNSDGAR
jgi:hypothetical protein